MEALLIVLVLLSMFIFPVIGATIADDRGYHACLGAAIGFFGGILGILILLVLPKQARPPAPPSASPGPDWPRQRPWQPERPGHPERDQDRYNRPHWEP